MGKVATPIILEETNPLLFRIYFLNLYEKEVKEMIRNKIIQYFLNKSQKCFERHDWEGWKRYFMLAWRFTDRKTQDIVRPAILEQFEEAIQTIESMQEA